jgi:hypothetical protein
VKRVLGIVLLGVGIALAVFAAGLRFYVTPIATNIPYDLEPSTTVAEAPDAVYLNVTATGARPESGAVRSTTYVVPQPGLTKSELTGDLAGKAVIWDVYSQIVDSSSGKVVNASMEQIALDRKTGAAAPWDGAFEDSGDGERPVAFEGHSYKLPFNAEQKTYPFWDGTLGTTADLNFVTTEEVSGLEAYKYTQVIPPTRIAYDPATLGALRAALGGGGGDVYYGVTRTIWVEPVTGQFLNVVQAVDLEFRPPSGNAVNLLSGTFEYTDETKANAKDTVSSNRMLLMLVSLYLPIGLGAAGLILIAVGIFLILNATRNPEGAPAPGAYASA